MLVLTGGMQPAAQLSHHKGLIEGVYGVRLGKLGVHVTL